MTTLFVSDHCQSGTGFRFSTDAGFLGSTGPADLRTGQCLFCFVVYFLFFFVCKFIVVLFSCLLSF